jgi:hypothetical protein
MGSCSDVWLDVGSAESTGSDSRATYFEGAVSSSTRFVGVGNRTSNCSIRVSYPHDLNSSARYSAFALSYGDPT